MTNVRVVVLGGALLVPFAPCCSVDTARVTGGTSTSSTGSGSSGRASSSSSSGSGGATSSSASSGSGGGTGAYPTAAVNVSVQRQNVEGFGFATSWGSVPTSSEMDAFFSTTKGAGLSIVRNRMPFREAPTENDDFMGGGNYDFTTVGEGADQYKVFTLDWSNWDLSATRSLITAIKANSDYQVGSYFSTPWTPPNNSVSMWKTGVADPVNHPEIGGTLATAHYQDYADVLADYALGWEVNMGAPLAALSLQNEPSFMANYESCNWTAADFHDFIAVLDTEFDKKGVFTQLPNLAIMAAEENDFQEDMLLPTLADANTASVLGIAAAHQYDYGYATPDPLTVDFSPLTQSLAAGKRIWMTEWNVDKFGTPDSIAANLALANLIHVDFTAESLNAFVYWWAADLVDATGPAKVLWTLGQWSRFVRPGWSRVDADAFPATDVLLSAYVDPTGTQTAIVVVNMGTTSQTLSLELDSKKFGTVTPYRTSATENMAALATLPGGSSTVTVTLAAQSITTFSASLEH